MAARDGAAVPAAPAVDWLTIARDALDHIGLQGPAGVLLSDLWLETSCAASLVPHIWRVLRSHAELRFFSGAEQAGWREWRLVDQTALSSVELAAMELEEAGRLRVLPSRQLHAKALRAGEHYESLFALNGRASDQWCALHEIARRGPAGVLQNELARLLDTAAKHLFYSLSVLQRLGLVVKEERKLSNPLAVPRVTITSLIRLKRFEPAEPARASDADATAATDAQAARLREMCLAAPERTVTHSELLRVRANPNPKPNPNRKPHPKQVTHSELRNRLGLMGHDQRRQWEHVKKRVSLFADVEVVSRRVPRKAGGEGSSSEKCFSFAERPAPRTAS